MKAPILGHVFLDTPKRKNKTRFICVVIIFERKVFAMEDDKVRYGTYYFSESSESCTCGDNSIAHCCHGSPENTAVLPRDTDR